MVDVTLSAVLTLTKAKKQAESWRSVESRMTAQSQVLQVAVGKG